ncbi:hypothetical protein GEMRC1_013609 [Eukaryota sp. GEM-RC1]
MSETPKIQQRRRRGTRSAPTSPVTSTLSQRLTFSNLNFSVTELEIRDLFHVYGPVKEVLINRTNDGKSLGNGSVTMLRPRDAERAQKNLDKSIHQGRTINVRMSAVPSPIKQAPRPTGSRTRGRVAQPEVSQRRRKFKKQVQKEHETEPKASVDDLNKQLSDYFAVSTSETDTGKVTTPAFL